MFAFMPPREAARLLFRMAADFTNKDGGEDVFVLIDVRKAQLSGKLEQGEWACIELPAEAGGGVVRLCRWRSGMRRAASACTSNPWDSPADGRRPRSCKTPSGNAGWSSTAMASHFCARRESLRAW